MQTLHLLQSFAVVVEGASESKLGSQTPTGAPAPHRGSSSTSTHTQDLRDEEVLKYLTLRTKISNLNIVAVAV